MSASALAHAIQVASNYLFHLRKELPVACAKEGHTWDSSEGIKKWEHRGGEWIKPSEDVFCDRGHYKGGREVVFFARTCTRCGAIETKDSVVINLSPFK